MNVQEAVRACRRRVDIFARPDGWVGSGRGVDLGRHLDPTRTRQVVGMESGALSGGFWEVDPQDLLGQWKLVDRQQMAQERKAEARRAADPSQNQEKA
jgi:hypothetical protein